MTHQSKKALGLQKKQSVFSNGLVYRQFESSGNSLYILPTKEFFPFFPFSPFSPFWKLCYTREKYIKTFQNAEKGEKKGKGEKLINIRLFPPSSSLYMPFDMHGYFLCLLGSKQFASLS